MKKKMGGIILAICMLTFLVNINLTQNTVKNNEFVLHDIEALAQSEGGEWECYGSGSIICPNGKYYRAVYTR